MGASMSITLKQNSQSVANNTSSVTLTVKITTNNGTYNQLNTAKATVKVTGSYTNTWNFNTSFGKNTTTTILTKTFTVNHSSTGTAKITASGSCVTVTSAGTIKATKSLTLTTIPRASVPTVSGTKQLGSTMTINTNRKSSSFTHTVSWSWAGKSGTISSSVGASVKWTPAIATFAPYLTNKTSSTCTITCVTKNGSTTVGTKTVTFTLSIPSSVVPSITSSTATDLAGYLDTYDAFVQNKSNIQLAVVAAGIYGSTISKYAASLGSSNVSGSSATLNLGAPASTGDQSISVMVTDSRSRTKSGTTAISVAAYTNPVLTVTAYRYNPDTQVEDDESSTVRVEITGSVCNINDKGLNTGTVKIEWKLTTATEWTLANEADRGQSFSFNYDISGLLTTNKYNIRVTLTDDTGTAAIYEQTIMTAQPILDFYKTGSGIAIGAVANTDNTVKFGYDLDLESTVKMEYNGVPFLQAQSDSGRPVLVNHTALANGMYLQGQTATGGYSNILRMNESNQVELNWTSGGLKGRVMKEIWSGNWSSGTITISEAPYYSVFVFDIQSIAGRAICFRENDNLRAFGFQAYKAYDGTDAFLYFGVSATFDSTSTKLTMSKCHSFALYEDNTTGNHVTSGTVLRIYGLL